jgi:class 3 adenylate cyclase
MTTEAVTLELKGFDGTVNAYRVQRRSPDRLPVA